MSVTLLAMLVTNTALVDALHNLGDSARSWESNKLAMPGISVSYVARRAGVDPSSLFNWRRSPG
jgi:hypothetical protein